MSFIAFFSVWSALFLAIVFLPIQLVMVVYLLIKLFSLLCVTAAFQLENPPNNGVNPTPTARPFDGVAVEEDTK